MDWENRGQFSARRSNSSLLRVSGLTVWYSDGTHVCSSAIVDMSFELQKGEILGVVGESGAGKSTLLASILNLLPPGGTIRKGSIWFAGQNILDMTPRELDSIRGRHIALINQEPSVALHPTKRVRDQVAEVLAAHTSGSKKMRGEKVHQVLTDLFLEDIERIGSAYPHQLSGGQRQRVLIAMALVCEPSLILADEPTASVDCATQREILSLFGELRHKFNTAVILITHNPMLLAGLADRVLVLYAGRLAEVGPVEDVLRTPRHPYTRALLRCALPPVDLSTDLNRKVKLYAIPGESPRTGSFLQGCQFEPRCSERSEGCRRREPIPVLVNDNHAVSCFKYFD